jgi:hypothetical protein
MDRLNDQEIGRMWAHHYPMRKDNGLSWDICLSITYIAKARASLDDLNLNYFKKIDEILSSLRIPKDEFCAVDTESKAA